MEEIKKLKKRLYVAIWAFYDHHLGTFNHVNTLNRIYELSDKLKALGVTEDELSALAVKAQEGGHYTELI